MASKTTTRVVVTVALIGAVAYFAPEALDRVGTFLGDAVGANDAVVIGEGETALMVAANAKAKVVNCHRGHRRPEILRRPACGAFKPNYGGQCDEYPMASTAEGGTGVRTEEVPPRENQCQGPRYRSQYPSDGERFLVVISRPDLIATTQFTGADIAKEQGRC